MIVLNSYTPYAEFYTPVLHNKLQSEVIVKVDKNVHLDDSIDT